MFLPSQAVGKLVASCVPADKFAFNEQSHIKYSNFLALIFLVTIGDNSKLVASGVPADHLALNLADSFQLPGCEPKNVHLGTPAG